MGIDVVLQDEKCNNISEVVYDPEGLIVTTLQSLGDATGCCARFIDPYGDTVFNHLQADVLLGEWDTLKSSFTALNAQALWCAVRRMITRCAEEPHTYLRFSGD